MDKELTDLKKELKCWESMFNRKYGKRPTKEDIDQSAPEIKESYKRYAFLKSGGKTPPDKCYVTQSTQNVEDDGVFSASLNKKTKLNSPEQESVYRNEAITWRPKLKPIKRPKTEEKENKENVIEKIEVEENQNETMNFQILTCDEKPVTPSPRTISFRRKSQNLSRFKHISQDLLNTCKDVLLTGASKKINVEEQLHQPANTRNDAAKNSLPLIEVNVENEIEKTVSQKVQVDISHETTAGTCQKSEHFAHGELEETSKEEAINENVTFHNNSMATLDKQNFPELDKSKFASGNFLENLENISRKIQLVPDENIDCIKDMDDEYMKESITEMDPKFSCQDEKPPVAKSQVQCDVFDFSLQCDTTNEIQSAVSKFPKRRVTQKKSEVLESIHSSEENSALKRKRPVDEPPPEENQPKKRRGRTRKEDAIPTDNEIDTNALNPQANNAEFDNNADSEGSVVAEEKQPKKRRGRTCKENSIPVDNEIDMKDISPQGDNTELDGNNADNEEHIEEEKKPKKRRRRAPAKPSVDNEKTVEGCDQTTSKDDVKSKKVSVTKKTAAKSKLVSDNFVKIDIRKKTYVRGFQNKMTGAKYKRQQWKKKTSFQLPTKSVSKTGKSVCFKCGGEGHWAKFCKGPKPKVDPFSKLDSEKSSVEFQHMEQEGGSCFDYLEVDGKPAGSNKGVFSMDDVMDIQPIWPRIPYQTTVEQEADALPLFESVDDEPSQSAQDNVSATLKVFGYDSFRQGQFEAITRIVSGLSTLVILSTGSGKSLCYQLPAYLYYKEKKALTIVVSPLVALMQDQVAGLPPCLPGACLNSNMTKLQKERVLKRLKDGELAVLLVSPETLVSGGFGYGMLPPKHTMPPIAFACIDEAHCLSEWSHNFRPSYLNVCKVLQTRYNIKCLLGLTATASLGTAKSVIHHLGIESVGAIIRDPHPIPENLQITASRDANRDQALVELLQIPPFDECDSIIVYATRRTEVERIAEKLRVCLPDFTPVLKDEDDEKKNKKKSLKVKARKNSKPVWWNVEAYHAVLTPAQRKRVQNEFMCGQLRIVVATVAFGMGLDKADVRSVIHYNLPKSFENYVQEIGRAGRDGKPSFCHVFISEEAGDLNEIRRHIYGNSIDRRTVETFVDLAFPFCRCAELNKKNTVGEQTAKSEQKEIASTPLEYFDSFGSKDHGTIQSLSDDEIEALFSEQFDEDICNDLEEHFEDITSKKISPESELASLDGDKHSHVKTKGIHGENSEIDFVRDSVQEQLRGEQVRDIEHPQTIVAQNEDFQEHPCDKIDGNSPGDITGDNGYYCSGHRICFSVDDAIASLDMREENIATLMSYLELHEKKWLEVLNPIRGQCSLKCYGGPEQFQLLAKKFHPVAIAVRHILNDDAQQLIDRRGIDFNFAEVADIMCWEVMTVAREVRSLQWNMDFALDAPLNSTGKSGIIVECENLCFHVVTNEGINDEEKDEMCDYLYESVVKQEETRLLQLDALYQILQDLSCQFYWQVKSNVRVDGRVRDCIAKYFMSDEEGQTVVLREMCKSKVEEKVPERRWNGIAGDIRTILCSHPEHSFTGRAIARIFHGIDSPRYPAIVFGKDRRFWRTYLDVDFNELRFFATKTVNRLKGISDRL